MYLKSPILNNGIGTQILFNIADLFLKLGSPKSYDSRLVQVRLME